MEYTINYNEQDQYFLVEIKGELSMPLLQKLAVDVAKEARKRKCYKVINNLLGAKIVKSTLDIYKMPEIAQNAGINLSFKRALVVGDREKEFYFLETVFKNQGHQVKMFADFEDARAWLLSKS